MNRAQPFAGLDDFQPKPKPQPQPEELAKIDQIAKAHDFPSRQATRERTSSEPQATSDAPRQYFRTGRNIQINMKAKAETVELLRDLSREEKIPLAEVLERALACYASRKKR